MDSPTVPDPDVELGRRIIAALLSYHLGIGLEYALKRYVPAEVDPSWSELGRGLLRGMQHQFVSRIMGSERPQ